MIQANQVAVGTAAVSLGTIPGGCQAALSVPAGGTVYLGNGTSVSTASGAPFGPGYALLPAAPVAAAPSTLFAVSAAGTAIVGVILSTPR